MSRASLGSRMKGYESVSKNYLMRRQPVIIRLDGKAFHTFTRGFDKPFDDIFMESMEETMKYLCENIQGCVLGYTQSDEISLVLCDYQKLDTDAWFGYNVQKIVSVSASMTTLKFNQMFTESVTGLHVSSDEVDEIINGMSIYEYYDNLETAARNGAMFDSRAFTVPIEEVNNYLLWRQQDATRNSIQALAQSLYSHKELQGVSTKALQDKMFTEKGVNWNDLPTCKKRGSCSIKTVIQNPNVDIKDGNYPKEVWEIDTDIPIFSQDTDYVNSRIIFK